MGNRLVAAAEAPPARVTSEWVGRREHVGRRMRRHAIINFALEGNGGDAGLGNLELQYQREGKRNPSPKWFTIFLTRECTSCVAGNGAQLAVLFRPAASGLRSAVR